MLYDERGNDPGSIAIGATGAILVDLLIDLVIVVIVFAIIQAGIEIVENVSYNHRTKSKSKSKSKSEDKVLADVKIKRQEGKHYQLAYISSQGDLIRIGKK